MIYKFENGLEFILNKDDAELIARGNIPRWSGAQTNNQVRAVINQRFLVKRQLKKIPNEQLMQTVGLYLDTDTEVNSRAELEEKLMYIAAHGINDLN